MGVAVFVAASRVADNKHHPADVVGGAVLGTSVSLFVHSLWFPPSPTVFIVVPGRSG
jgi:membrane-associated phospholipid phosphatase